MDEGHPRRSSDGARPTARALAWQALAGQRLGGAWATVLDWMLPTVCVGCEQVAVASRGSAPRGWCQACADGLPGLRARRCPVCGERRRAEGPCRRCQANPPAFTQSIVLADYGAPLDHLVQAIKFGRQSALAPPLGRLLADAVVAHLERGPALPGPVLLTVVPLAPARLAERGFNQALLLAAPLARRLGLKTDARVLQRIRHGAPASSLDATQRRGALDHAFVARGVPEAATVLVVDDVMTTGATLQATAQALKAAGAGMVINCVAARTPYPAR